LAPALGADGVEVSDGVFCDGLSSEGEVRLLGAKVSGVLLMNGAKLKSMVDKGGSPRPAFSADRIAVSGGIFCEGLSSEGEVRLIGAKVGGQISMNGAALEGIGVEDGELAPAFNASGAEVSGGIFFMGLSSEGSVRLLGAKIARQLVLVEVRLTTKGPGNAGLTLIATEIDELVLAFSEIDGEVDLTDAKVRSLWDAKQGAFLGQLPNTLRLQGFHYESLREPLSAKQRLDWIERSQREQHYPEVYAELADAYRRIGRRSDAREIGIANERRAREDGGPFKKLWNYLLWKSVRYGYENWRAAVGLLTVIVVGSIVFWLAGDHFVKTVREPPDLSPIIYATDAAIPVLDLGQTNAWAVTGWLEWVELALAISGYALVAAVIAGLAGIFNRDQV
jgi:hypothetical protein